jgi:hypothetical protein
LKIQEFLPESEVTLCDERYTYCSRPDGPGAKQEGKIMSKDLKDYATKDITPTMAAFAEWLLNETGYEVDARTVALS